MKPLKGVLCLAFALLLSPICYAQSTKAPQVRITNSGNLEIVDSKGKVYTFKSITLQEEVIIDGKKYKISFGPGATSGDMVVILQPETATKVAVSDPDFSKATLGIPADAVAIITFNAKNHTLVVESGNVGTITVNGVALQKSERVAVNTDGTLVRNLGNGPAPASSGPGTEVAQNGQPGAPAGSNDQPIPTFQDVEGVAGSGNNFFADMSINLNPEAATPVVSGQ